MAPDYECPKCGIVYAKYNALRQPAPAAAAPAPKPPKATATKNLKAMFAKIENREGAIKVAKENGILFMVVAGIQGVLGFFIAKVLLLDAAAFATCGLFIYYKHSRVAAVIALLLSAAALASTIMNITGHKVGGGNNIFLAVIVVAGGVRAVEATFKLAGRFKERATRGVQKPTPPSTAIVAVGSTPVDNSAGTPPA